MIWNLTDFRRVVDFFGALSLVAGDAPASRAGDLTNFGDLR